MNSQPLNHPAAMRAFVLPLFLAMFFLCAGMSSLAPAAAYDGGLNYYVFSRSDLRLCPSPVCGGMYVRKVNRFLTRCGDGRFRTECYIADLDLSPLGLQDNDVSRINTEFTAGKVLVRASFEPFSTAFSDVSVLVASEAWEEKGTAQPALFPVFFRDNGIRCFTYPCPSIDATILNTPISGTLSGFDLNSSGATAEEIDEGYRSLSSGGIIATGHLQLISGPAGDGLNFEAGRFYLKVRGAVCGGDAGLSCPGDMFCDIAPPDACSGQNLAGTCRSVPEACTMIYAPVCGCDGKTYSNDCERIAARVLPNHAGECTKTGHD